MRICDVCEAPVDREPIRLGWGGAFYEADLCEKHGGQLAELVESFIPKARRLGADTSPRPEALPAPATRRAKVDTKDVRDWAKRQGIEVNDKGRVPEALIVQFLAAGQSS
jgi:hypothetical protein